MTQAPVQPETLSPPSEDAVCCALHQEFYPSSAITVPRYTPLNWWECDFYRITPKGYAYEYEIKHSVSDFRKDAKKKSYVYPLHKRRTKHSLIAEGWDGAPNYFTFVIHFSIIDKIKVPEWAGLMAFGRSKWNPEIVRLLKRKRAPRIHGKRIDDLNEAKAKICHSFWYRYWSLLDRKLNDSSNPT